MERLNKLKIEADNIKKKLGYNPIKNSCSEDDDLLYDFGYIQGQIDLIENKNSNKKRYDKAGNIFFRNSKNFDYFNIFCRNSIDLFEKLPEPLPWIEPSINMLYLEAVSSFVFRNTVASFILIGTLLEHVLKLAMATSKEPVQKRLIIDEKQIDKDKIMLHKLIKQAIIKKTIIEETDEKWWLEIGKVFRNKFAHYTPKIIIENYNNSYGFSLKEDNNNGFFKIMNPTPSKQKKQCSDVLKKFLEKYCESNLLEEFKQNEFFSSLGYGFYHHNNYYSDLALGFIKDATEQINKIIKKKNWKELSGWEGQRNLYDSFFKYNWNSKSMKRSLNRYDMSNIE